ncbi:DUF6239 family natural product biosynthesis protein [Actinophytocola sp.]|uniref:DUF6239 family natural product biosynthesis protein n=1 Tax=Actinophytocola sp. TaxID=1872138 RepID=UPI002D77DE8D|nr:DUF6239 family natural product biosynthesis protein [Actinophytocola sp.]
MLVRHGRDRARPGHRELRPMLAAALQHEHGSVGIVIGPMALRVLLLSAVMVVAAFAALRGFTGPPAHRTAVWVWSAAAAVVVVELLLSGGLDVPRRVIPLVLAATAAPAYAIFSRDRRWAVARGALRTAAPWLCGAAATLAAVEFARAWLTATGDQRTTLLHTGVQLAGVAVTWLVISHPRRGAASLYTTAVALGMLLVAGVSVTLTSGGAGPASVVGLVN